GAYLVLNAIIIGSGLAYLVRHPDALASWYGRVTDPQGNWHFHSPFAFRRDWWGILAVTLLFFPKLALGLSGFETGVAVMPLIKGEAGDDPAHPRGLIRNTRKLLLTAACLMSVMLLASSLVVSTLIPPEALVEWDARG